MAGTAAPAVFPAPPVYHDRSHLHPDSVHPVSAHWHGHGLPNLVSSGSNGPAWRRDLSARPDFPVHVSADVRADFGSAGIFWQSRADSHFIVSQHRGVASVHLVYQRVGFRKARSKLADCYRESRRHPICLVQLSPRATEPPSACPRPGCFSQLALSQTISGWRVDCSCGRDQSLSSARHSLSYLSALLDGGCGSSGYPHHFALHSANSISWVATNGE